MNAQIATATTLDAPAPAPLMMECPICFDDINPSKNCIITECNHTFHSSCMLKSIVHGNFDCPCCRFELAEMPEDEEEKPKPAAAAPATSAPAAAASKSKPVTDDDDDPELANLMESIKGKK